MCDCNAMQGAAATFTNLTLLVPGSIRVGGLAGLYDAASIAKLGLDHQVRAFALTPNPNPNPNPPSNPNPNPKGLR